MRWWSALVILGLLIACQPGEIAPTMIAPATQVPSTSATPPPVASPSSLKTLPTLVHVATETPTSLHADLVISDMPSGSVIQVKVGQEIEIVPPLRGEEWQVTFDSGMIVPLTPFDEMHKPGSPGWFFRVIALGVSDLMLTTIPPPCPSQMPCPVTVARFIYTIQADK